MIEEFMKAAGVSSEEEFLQKYPTEEAFFAEFPEYAPQNNKAVSRVNTKSALDNYLKGIKTANATSADKNAELEKDEYLNDAEGVHKMQGNTHEDGGIAMNLNEGDRILSDEGKPNKKYRKALEEKYGIKIKEGDTFAKILDRVNGKIGFKNVQEGERDLIKKAEKNQEVKDEATRVMNEKLLADKASILEKVKNFKNAKKQEAFNTLYAVQEAQKPAPKELENGVYVDEETGVEVKFENGGVMYKKSQMPILVKMKLSNGYKSEDDLKNHFISKMSNGGMKKKNYYNLGGQYGLAAINAYLESKSDRPNYDYGDLTNTAKRFKELADIRGIKYDDIKLNDLSSLDKLAGRVQEYDFNNDNELATDYGIDVPLTKNGIDLFLTIPDLTSDLKVKNKDLYNKILSTKRGMLESKFTEDENKLISNIVREKSPLEFQKKFAKANYNDNKAYFRGIDKKVIQFNDENEYKKFLEDNAKNKIGDFYKTSKSGIYIKPEFVKSTTTNTATTPQKVEEAAATPAVKKVEEAIAPIERLPNPRWGLDIQGTPPPSNLQLPMLINPQVRDQAFVKVSPEQAIRENQRSLNYMGEQLRETESGTQGAAFANLALKMFEANNQAVDAANVFNATQRVNYDNEMSRRLDGYDVLRSQNLANYVQQSQMAESNTFNDWRSYFQDRESIERQALKDARLMNMYEAITPNQNLNPRTGRITYTKPSIGNWFNK